MDVDLNQLFMEKNKEIIRNNLVIDIERNIKVLKDTIINIVNNNFDIALKNIDTIFSDSYCENYIEFISEEMIKLRENLLSILFKGIDVKSLKLVDKVHSINFNEKEMDNYNQLVLSSSTEINNILCDNIIGKTIVKLDKYIDNNVKDDYQKLTKSRVDDYLLNRLFGKVQDQIKDQLSFRDTSLFNKGNESYLKYKEICEKTISS